MAIPTSDLAASLDSPFLPFQYTAFPPPQPFFNSLPNDNDKRRPPRKMSMTDTKPIRQKSGPRAMSFSHPTGLQTHFENQPTDSTSPPDFAFGYTMPPRWDNASSFDTSFDDAIIDSPPLDQEQSKKQRRRECHNQVEKRRREHINAKIEELGHLLPPQYNQDEEEEEDDSPKKRKPRRNSMAKKDAGPCKGRVLTHSVQYIQDLRHANDLQATRIQQLEAMLAGTSFTQRAAPPVFYSPNLQQMPASPDWNYNFTNERPLPRMRTNSDMDVNVPIDNVFHREPEW